MMSRNISRSVKLRKKKRLGLLGTEDNDHGFKFTFDMVNSYTLGATVAFNSFTYYLPYYLLYSTPQTLTIKIPTCSDKSNHKTRKV